MSKPYPYLARSLMRFQAQDGQFTLNNNQVVTVTGPNGDAAEWLNVTDAQGVDGTVPAGFLIPIEQQTSQETDTHPGVADPSASEPQNSPHGTLQPDHPVPSMPITSDAAERMNVTDEPVAGGTVPTGFLIPMEQQTLQETDPYPGLADPSPSQPQTSLDDSVQSDHPVPSKPTTSNEAERLNVTDEQVSGGTVPTGFLIPMEQQTLQETDPYPGLADPSASQPQISLDDSVQSDHPVPSKPTTSSSIQKPASTVPNTTSAALPPAAKPSTLVVDSTVDAAELSNVIDEQGADGTVPTGFLIPIEQRTSEETDPHPSLADPSASQPQTSPDDTVQSDHPAPSKPATSSSIQQPLTTVPNISNPVESLPHVSSSPQTASKSPTPSAAPPPAAKPSTLRDRIAMFNNAGPLPASPPPNTRPKPPPARKPTNFPMPAPPVEARASQETLETSLASHEDEISHSVAQAGMSAADAEESVKASGSLKDRIRLLQQQQQAVVPDPSSAPHKPKREWKRPSPQPAHESSVPIPLGLPTFIPHEATVEGEGSPDHVTEPVPNAAEENIDTVTDEQAELQRRQKIAERMAKLGGAKLGFGFPGAIPGLKPAVSPKQSTETEPVIQSFGEPTAEESSSTLQPEKIVMPSMPKRAAPPRRKAPSPANVPTSSDVPLADSSQVITPSNEPAQPVPDDSMLQTGRDDELPVAPLSTTSSPHHDLPNSNVLIEDAAL